MPPTAVRPRLIHLDLRPHRAGESLVLTPAGGTFRIGAAPERVHALLLRCDGITELDAVTGGDLELREVIEVLMAEGCLIDAAADAPADAPDDAPDAAADNAAVRGAEAGADIRAQPRTDAETLSDPDALGAARAGRRPILLTGADTLTGPLAALLQAWPAGARPLPAMAGPVTVARAAADAGGVVLAADCWPNLDWFVELDEACEDAEVPWLALHLDQGRGYLGPAVLAGRTANHRDLIARRRCAIDEIEVFESLTARPVRRVPVPEDHVAWITAAAAVEVQVLAGHHGITAGAVRTFGVELELDPATLRIHRHVVLPLPHRPLDAERVLMSAERGPDLLVGERTGVIQRVRTIRHHADVPGRLHTVQTHNANMGRVDPQWANDVITGGSTFDDPAGARASAIGEAVERYCGNYMGQNELRWGSFAELDAAGEDALDPDRLVLYGDSLYDKPGFPFVRFTRELTAQWVRGRSLTRGRPMWLPVSLVYVNWLAGAPDRHPLTNYMNFSGVAAGTDLDRALVSGIEELVERDATMIWWLNAQPLPALRPDPDLAALADARSRAAGQHLWSVPLPNQFGIPVAAGVAHHTIDDWFTIGFAARPTIEQATAKAWTEALTLQEGSRDLDLPDSLIRQAVDWGFASYAGLKDHRADRRYLDSYRDDFRDVADLMCQQQIFLDRRAVAQVLPFVRTAETMSAAEVPPLPDRSLATYRERLEKNGFEVCYVDLTTPDVALAGMRAVRVLIPGLVPNFPAAFPMLGGGRVQRAAVDLGWRTTPLAEDALNYWPLPHA